MSKKRDRNKSQECQCPKCQGKSGQLNNGLGNNPFGINPSQLMGMLGNIDMSQIGNILNSMNKDGFDLNNLNLGSVENNMGGMNLGNNNQDLSSIEKMMAGMNINNMMGNSQPSQSNINFGRKTYENRKHSKENNINEEMDENIEMLMSIKKIVNEDRGEFIDRVIELYNNGAFE